MNIDMYFVIFLSTFIVGIESLILFLQYRSIKEDEYKTSLFWWTLSTIFYLFSYITGYLRGTTFLGLFAIILNNFFSLSAVIGIYIGTVKYYKEYSLKKWHFISTGIAVLIASYYTLINYNLQIRSINFSMFIAIISLMTARVIYKNCIFKDQISKLFFLLMNTHGLFYLLRAIIYFLNPDKELFSASSINKFTSIEFLLFSIMLTFCYVLMLNFKLTSKTLEDKENLEMILNTNPEILLITRKIDGKIVIANDILTKKLGYLRDEVLGKTTFELNIWNNKEKREEFVKNLENLENIEVEISKKNGEKIMCLISANIIKIKGEDHIISILRDITERKELEMKLEENEDFLSDIIENNPALIYAKDVKGRYKLVNRTWENFMKMESENVIGKTDLELFGESVAENVVKVDNTVLNGENALEKEEILSDSNGIRYFLSNKFPMKNKDKIISGICGVSLEITEQKKSEEKIKDLLEQIEIEKRYAEMNSVTDTLTRINNRRYFDDILRREFYNLKRNGLPLSMIIMDVDYFKKYNDTYGHQGGDECLKTVAKAIKKSVPRETDTVARYGGEEFTVILPNTDRYGAMELAERIRSAVESLNIPHNSSLISDRVTMSLGVATAYKKNLSFPEQIISFADEALYKAKEKGRNRIEFSESLSKLENNTNLVTLTWNGVDESGNHTIDEQHKTLLEDSNKLITALINRASKEECTRYLDKLIEDIKIHFKDEEDIFLKTKYPYAKNHIISHENLIKKAEILRNKNYPIPPNLGEVISFVIYDVIAQHLAIEDKGYFPYISEDI